MEDTSALDTLFTVSYCVMQAAEHGAKASDVHASDVTLLPQMVQKDEESLSRFFMR